MHPALPEDPNDRGVALAKQGRLPEAVPCFLEALRQRPDRVAAAFNLAHAYDRLNQPAEAERAFERAIRLDPEVAKHHFELARLLHRLGRIPEACISYRHAARCQPGWTEPLHLAFSLYMGLQQAEEALECCRKLLAIDPNSATLLNEQGNALRLLKRDHEAILSYREAVRLDPTVYQPYANLGACLSEEGDGEAARAAYGTAYRLSGQPALRVLRDTVLPVILEDVAQIDRVRSRLDADLDACIAEGIRVDPTSAQVPTRFYLAYHGRNDRPLHEKYARLTDGPRAFPVPPPPRPAGRKIRLGVLSRHLRNHTIGRLNCGWMARLPRDRFEVTLLSVGEPGTDHLGLKIRSAADRVLDLMGRPEALVPVLAGLPLDLLFFPDVGMDGLSHTLAHLRFAAVQATTWGHPVTTGLPTIDHFLSAVDLEVEGAQDHYSEQLTRLPRLAVWYERPDLVEPLPRSAFGLPDTGTLYLCPQSLFKLHPEFDPVLAAILRGDPRGWVVFLDSRRPGWRAQLEKRFARTMPDVAHRIRWVPPQPHPHYMSLVALGDVMLDTLHFGGGNTSYEGFALGIPIVTLPSRFLRGRLTHAMYRRMGLAGLEAASPEEYAALAVRLGTEPDLRRHWSRQIREAMPVLFEDDAAVRDLADWFERIVREPAKRTGVPSL